MKRMIDLFNKYYWFLFLRWTFISSSISKYFIFTAESAFLQSTSLVNACNVTSESAVSQTFHVSACRHLPAYAYKRKPSEGYYQHTIISASMETLKNVLFERTGKFFLNKRKKVPFLLQRNQRENPTVLAERWKASGGQTRTCLLPFSMVQTNVFFKKKSQ